MHRGGPGSGPPQKRWVGERTGGDRVSDRVVGSAAAVAVPGSMSGAGNGGRTCGFAEVTVMLDFLMVAGGVGFFVIAILYVIACEKM